jgi:uncharacterized protein YeeX (DUF496 family)
MAYVVGFVMGLGAFMFGALGKWSWFHRSTNELLDYIEDQIGERTTPSLADIHRLVIKLMEEDYSNRGLDATLRLMEIESQHRVVAQDITILLDKAAQLRKRYQK